MDFVLFAAKSLCSGSLPLIVQQGNGKKHQNICRYEHIAFPDLVGKLKSSPDDR